MKKHLLFACAISVLSACTQYEFQDEFAKETKNVTFTTSFEYNQSRTYINEYN